MEEFPTKANNNEHLFNELGLYLIVVCSIIVELFLFKQINFIFYLKVRISIGRKEGLFGSFIFTKYSRNHFRL